MILEISNIEKRTSMNDCKKCKYILSIENMNKRAVPLEAECKEALLKGQRGAYRYKTGELNKKCYLTTSM